MQSTMCIRVNSLIQPPMCHTTVVDYKTQVPFFAAALLLQVWLLRLNCIELKPGPLAKPWILVRILQVGSKLVKT